VVLDVLRRLRAAWDVYAILLTADAKEVDQLAGLAVGAVID
jgi:DNA-binding response OmpR family regulator